MKIDPRAGKLATASDLVDVPKLITAYYEDRPDPHIPEQRVIFGTSGRRRSSFDRAGLPWPGTRAWELSESCEMKGYESNEWMDGRDKRMDGRRSVALDGDRRTGGDPAGRFD